MVPLRSLLAASILTLATACGSDAPNGSTDPSEETFGYQSSPANGEAGVATTRESILRFNLALDESTVSADALFATVDGNPIDTNVYVYKDGHRAALFYPEGLPGDVSVTVTVDGDKIRSESGLRLDGDQDGEPGGVGTFFFDTVSLRPVPGTDVCSRVFASELDDRGVNRALEGVRVSVDGAADTIFALTGADGRFCLEDAPAGRIFVHVDGTTATNAPSDAYYPSVGKAWETFAGERVHIGLIHLPAVADTSLQTVSSSSETSITFSPDQVAMVSDPSLRETLDGVVVTVPPDSLFSDDGSRGGSVGIAPVAADRLPGALPPGLDLPLVITVQTDGATNFDEEAPVCFMNLPDPVTGELQSPGDTTSLWSFNHDTGRFEIVGPMTVSEDGESVCSDPGIGILAPGWHGWSDGTEGILFRPPWQRGCGDAQLDSLQALQALVACTAGIAGAGPVVSRVKELAKQLGRVSKAADGFETAMDSYLAGDSSRGDVQNAVTQVRTIKGPLGDLIQGASDAGSPLKKAEALVKCAEQTVKLAQEPCRQLSGGLFGCRQENPAVARMCEAVPQLAELLSVAKTMIQAANLQLKDVAMTAVCRAIDEVERELTAPTSSEDRLRDALEELDRTTRAVPRATESEIDMLDLFWDAFVDFNNDTGDAAASTDDSSPRLALKTLGITTNAYVKLELGRAVQRFRTDESGFYRALMPADSYYVLWTYEPSTERCGVAFGKSAPPGERSFFHGPLQGECVEPDTDGDGVPDIAEEIVGTATDNSDTDGDGIDDATELRAGTDPGGRSTIQPGDLVEGDVSAPGEVDVWRLSVNSPSRFYHQILGVITSSGQLRFEWFAPDGSALASGTLSPSDRDYGLPFEAPTAGVYTLRISAVTASADGSYRFRVHQPRTERFELHVGEPSSGRIAVPGDIHRWELEASAGDELFFDMQEMQGRDDALGWFELRSPSDAIVFNALPSPQILMDAGPFTLVETGLYTLVVGIDFLPDVYDYRFVLGGIVSVGGGAISIGSREDGEIASAGSSQEWTFDASAGERVFVDMISAEGEDGAILEYDLIAPSGASVFNGLIPIGFFAEAANVGATPLTETGSYRLVFRSESAGLRYAFALHKPGVDVASVTRGVRTQGSISVPGEVDEWRFFASAGEDIEIMIDAVTDPLPDFAVYQVELFAPSGAALLDAVWQISNGVAYANIPAFSETGTYRFVMSVPNASEITFDYSFTVP